MSQQLTHQSNREWLWLIAIISIGFVMRAAAIASFNHALVNDELAYMNMALNLANGDVVVDQLGNHALYNVGYPLFILSPIFLFFGENLMVARFCNMLLGGVTIVLSYLVAKEAGAGKLGRLTAASIWAVYLPSSVYAVYLIKENLMIPMMLGVIWCALRLVRRPSKKVTVLCGALFGLLALTGNAALSLIVVIATVLVLAPAPITQRVTLAILILTVAVGVSAPWVIRNMHVIGAPVLNTNGGFNLYLGNNPAATGMFVSISDTPRGSTWEDLRKTGEFQASETLKQEAIGWIKANPIDFAMLSLKKAAYFWTPPFHAGKGNPSTTEKVVRIFWAIQFVFIIIAAFATLLIPKLRTGRLAILWLSVICYTAVHMLFYVIFRYREPIMPVMGVLAAIAIESLSFNRWLSPKSSVLRRFSRDPH